MDSLTRRLRRVRPAVDDDAYDRELVRRQVLYEPASAPRLGNYELGRRLGQGAMGVVYEARNVQRTGEFDELVALKALCAQDPHTLSLLKREFRALAGVHHENLCTLHELHIEDGSAYFTMELVHGRDFLRHVWDTPPNAQIPQERFADFTRVRAVLRQLVAGLGALHQAGKIHRDIKPSNVLVSHDGRVTVLDFGLIATLQTPDSTFGCVVGTPLYMAPEQLNASVLSPASDWYAVGTMLYHVLVGHAPCEGLTVHEIRERKNTQAPPRPSEVCPGISEELDDLVHDLLQPDPAARPTGEEVLERLGWKAPRTLRASHPRRDEQHVFVGRERELAQLDSLLRESQSQSVAVVVTGATGVGKTTLVRRFLDGLDPRRHVILATRCHERESISHKVLDGVIDALAHHLRKLPPAVATRMMPRHVHELARLFPALQRVEAVVKAPRSSAASNDKTELRRRAVAALRELLARIADEAVLVIWVDDLQWGDVDSMVFVKRVFGAPEAPLGLFIGTYTGGHEHPLVPLERIVSAARANGSSIRAERIDVEPLPSADACALAAALLTPEGQSAAVEVAREAGGNPLLIQRFALFMVSTGMPVQLRADAFDDMIRRQVHALSAPARELLRVVAVARSAIEQRVAIAAARTSSSAASIAELRRSSLIRTEGSQDRGFIEIDHARLANAITLDLDRHALNDIHARIAAALVQFNCTDHERVARHLRRMGERAQATRYLLTAAEQAAQNVAFERAARLYRMALGFGVTESERGRTEAALGDALRNAGRSLEAAEAYQRAVRAEGLPQEERIASKRKAARELMFCGMFDRAQPLIEELCREAGVDPPGSRLSAIAGLLKNRAYLALRGLHYQARPLDEASQREAARADTYWMLGQGLVILDPVRGNSFLNRNVRCSLRSGDPGRIARALAYEAATIAWAGESARPRAEELLSVARQAAEAVPDPYPRAFVRLSSATVAFFTGDPIVGAREAKLVELEIREQCVGAAWELHSAHLASTCSNMQLGRWRAYAEQSHEVLEDALACGNLYRSVGIRAHTHFAKLIRDDVRGAQAEVDAVARDWSHQDFDMQHLTFVGGPARILLYQGDGAAACAALDEIWPRLADSMMLRAKVVFVELESLRGRAAAVAYAQHKRHDARSTALSSAGKLQRSGGFGARPAALVIRASVACTDGHAQRAEALLREAERLYETAQARSFAAMVRYQRGRLLGGKAGAALLRESERELREDSIVCVPAFTQLNTGFLTEQDP